MLIWCLLPLRPLEVKHLQKCACDVDFDCRARLFHHKGPLRIWLLEIFFTDSVAPVDGL